jgi:ribosomal protein S27E
MNQIDLKVVRPDGGMTDFTTQVARVPVAGDFLDVDGETCIVTQVMFSVAESGNPTTIPLVTAEPH